MKNNSLPWEEYGMIFSGTAQINKSLSIEYFNLSSCLQKKLLLISIMTFCNSVVKMYQLYHRDYFLSACLFVCLFFFQRKSIYYQ